MADDRQCFFFRRDGESDDLRVMLERRRRGTDSVEYQWQDLNKERNTDLRHRLSREGSGFSRETTSSQLHLGCNDNVDRVAQSRHRDNCSSLRPTSSEDRFIDSRWERSKRSPKSRSGRNQRSRSRRRHHSDRQSTLSYLEKLRERDKQYSREVSRRESDLKESRNTSLEDCDYRPASPLALEEYFEKERLERERLEQDKRDADIIAQNMEDLEEIEDIVIPEEKCDDALSLTSLPSVEEAELQISKGNNEKEEKHELSPISDEDIKGDNWNDNRFSKHSCLVCQGIGHVAKECPDLICFRCQLPGHFAKECRNRPVAKSSQSFEREEQKKACFNCHSKDHQIKQCPHLKCKKCGFHGHFAKECKYTHREGTSSSSVIYIDYGHSKSGSGEMVPSTSSKSHGGWDENTVSLPSKTLREHFSQVGNGRKICNPEAMERAWKMAGHSEITLKSLFIEKKPSSSPVWRLTLVKELSRAPAELLPLDLRVSDLLDVTVDYFFPSSNNESSSCSGQLPNSLLSTDAQDLRYHVDKLTDIIQNVNSLERFKELERKIDRHYSSNPHLRIDFDARVQEFFSLQSYIAERLFSDLKTSETYAYNVSSTLQKLLAHEGLSKFTITSIFEAYGSPGVKNSITDKFSQYEGMFPPNVTAAFIANLLCDFLRLKSQ